MSKWYFNPNQTHTNKKGKIIMASKARPRSIGSNPKGICETWNHHQHASQNWTLSPEISTPSKCNASTHQRARHGSWFEASQTCRSTSTFVKSCNMRLLPMIPTPSLPPFNLGVRISGIFESKTLKSENAWLSFWAKSSSSTFTNTNVCLFWKSGLRSGDEEMGGRNTDGVFCCHFTKKLTS